MHHTDFRNTDWQFDGMSVHGVCKLGCGVGSSLDEERILHRHPYPLLGTYLHGSGPSDLMFRTNATEAKGGV